MSEDARGATGPPDVVSQGPDEATSRLARLVREHPAWVAMAGYLSASSACTVYLTHRPGDAFRLELRGGRIALLPGAAADPDLVFRFAPKSIGRLEALVGGVADLAVALLELTAEDDPELHVDIRTAGSFTRLALRGYLRLLAAAGPKLVAFGARFGIASLGDLRRFLAQERRRGRHPWEVQDAAARGPRKEA